MKKSLLLGAAIGVSFSGICQNPASSIKIQKIDPVLANKAIPYVAYTGSETPVSLLNNSTAIPRALAGSVIGTSVYDLQTNSSVARRITYNADATISASFTMAKLANYTDRGTGYNYNDGSAWGTAPAARIENIRVGWPNIGVTASGNEVVITHEASDIHVSTRAKGTGTWSDANLGVTDLWPRMVIGGADGNTVHLIARTETGGGSGAAPIFQGQSGAMTYSRSLDGGVTWDKKQTVIPEMNATFYYAFGGDNYSIDANGDNIAIAFGGLYYDVVLMKSTDNGTTWTRTVVSQFPIAKYDPYSMISDIDNDNVADTVLSCDGSVHVLLDNNNKAHVWFGNMRMLDDDAAAAVSYFPGTDGLMYWNEVKGGAPELIASALDLNANDVLDVTAWGSYGTSLTSMPSAGIDANGVIYLAYAGIVEGTDDGNGKSYRQTYLMKSSDNGTTWSDPLNIIDDNFTEGVFASVAKKVTDKVHVLVQRDQFPGNALASDGTNPRDPDNVGQESEMVYMAVDVNSILSVRNSELAISAISVSPNPSNGIFNVKFNNENASNITISIVNMMGQVVASISNTANAGTQTMQVDASSLASGLYLVTVNNGTSNSSARIIVK